MKHVVQGDGPWRAAAVFLSVLLAGLYPSAGATPLDDYVAAADAAYSYSLVATTPGAGYTDYVLAMDSQNWLTAEEVDRTLWTHYLNITVPDTVNASVGLLRIGGGSTGDGPTSVNSSRIRAIGVATNTVSANLWCVPNQPLAFADSVARWEDSLIAYGWDQFLRGGRDEWLARFPMTKAAVRAMDTVSAFVDAQTGGAVSVTAYVVTGASKRGWTTWTTAAVDDRVVAFAPQVIDLLNLGPSFHHHYCALGRWADAIGDYVAFDIPLWFGTRPFQDLLDLTDPYSYRDRYVAKPKFLLNSAGDQFFLPDSSQFYFGDLPGVKHLRYHPNTGHGLDGSAWTALQAWYLAIVSGAPLPAFTWAKEADGSLVVNTGATVPSQVRLWQATNPTERNFNISEVGPIYSSSILAPTQPGEYIAQIAPPPAGWTAFFVELTYAGTGANDFVFTTEVSVVPDIYPASWDPDTDGDGTPDSIDTDDDDDGVLDEADARPLDTDDDALPNVFDEDDDNDLIPDGDESGYATDPLHPDSDGDGIADGLEVAVGTSPALAAERPGIIGFLDLFDAEGPALYSNAALDYGVADADGDLLPDRYQLALVIVLLDRADHALHDTVQDALLANIARLRAEAAPLTDLAPVENVLGAAILLSAGMRDFWVAALGLTGSYEVIQEAKDPNEPLSGPGDLDGDGTTNLSEYTNVMTHSGGLAAFYLAATDPFSDGSYAETPLRPWALAVVLLLAAAWFGLRYRGQGRSG